MINPTIIGKATLYNMDCMDLLKATPDKFYELAIVDVPYGRGEDKTTRTCRATTKTIAHISKNWDSSSPDRDYFNELIRVSKNQIVWGANHFISKIAIDSSCWIVWNKKTAGYTADCELAWTSFNTTVKKFDFKWEGFWQENMKNKETRIHPTQKPAALYEWLLTNYAKPGDKILDTHLGSGSHAIACNNLGFELTACELDRDYFDASVKRITQAKAQVRMFA